MSDTVHKIYRFDNFRLDPRRREFLRNEAGIQLPAKAFDLLVFMVENNGRLLEREELFQVLWPGQFVEESNLSVNVSALRRALGEPKTQYILTIPRQGYRFVADVGIEDVYFGNGAHYSETQLPVSSFTSQANESSESIRQDRSIPILSLPTDAAPLQKQRLKRRGVFVIGVLCLLAAMGFGYWRYQVNQPDPDSAAQMDIKRLTLHGKVVRAALSSDGKYFAYVREDKGERSLWLGQTSDGSSMQLRPPSEIIYGSLVFAPDDNSIYCVGTGKERQQSVLYRMSVLGGKTEAILEHINSPPAFSPDGGQIVFVRHSPEKRESELVAANAADGKEERVLAMRDWPNRFTSDGPSWSPDGTLIAVAALSRDSDVWDREVLAVQIADGSITSLAKQKWSAIHRLAWLRDGSGLVMVATDKPALEWLQIWHLAYPDGEARRITRDLTTYNQSSLSLSSDDRSMLAVQLQQVNNIWLAPATDLDEARQITFGPPGRLDGAYGLDWTPDGRILYTAFTGDGFSIWSMNPDGSESSQISPSSYVEKRLSLTTDGRYMVFESNRSGSREIWKSALDGSGPQQLTTGGKNRAPHISPDGRWVVYSSTRTDATTVWRVATDGGTPLQLTEKESSWPRFSPDGKQFACFYRPESDSSWQLVVFDIAGGPALKAFDLPRTTNFLNGPRWTPDGLAVTYRDWKEGIWRQPLNGGAAQRIPDLPKEKIYTYAWSPDGSQFAFTRGTESYDVVLISNFR